MTESNLVKVDFIVHCEVLVDATPEKVWSFFSGGDQPGSAQKFVPIGGPRGGVGERFHALSGDDPERVDFQAETVELQPARRRTLRFEAPDGAFLGFASWALAERNGQTGLSYDVYVRYDLPSEFDVQTLVAGTQRAMDEILNNMKARAETH